MWGLFGLFRLAKISRYVMTDHSSRAELAHKLIELLRIAKLLIGVFCIFPLPAYIVISRITSALLFELSSSSLAGSMPRKDYGIITIAPCT